MEYKNPGTYSWTVKPGVTKIKFTLIGGGNPSNLGISGKNLPAYTSDATIQLTGTYASLKGKTINVSLCGAGGGNGAQAYYCSKETGGYWLWGYGGGGGRLHLAHHERGPALHERLKLHLQSQPPDPQQGDGDFPYGPGGEPDGHRGRQAVPGGHRPLLRADAGHGKQPVLWHPQA